MGSRAQKPEGMCQHPTQLLGGWSLEVQRGPGQSVYLSLSLSPRPSLVTLLGPRCDPLVLATHTSPDTTNLNLTGNILVTPRLSVTLEHHEVTHLSSPSPFYG